MKNVFKDLIRIGMVVKDIEETVDNYSMKYGIGPWSIYDCGPGNIEDWTVKGREVDSKFRLAYCMLADTGLELIQPLDDKSIYSDFLKEKGQYLHHIGYSFDDFNDIVTFFKNKGFDTYQSGNFYSKTEFIYFNTLVQLKHIINLSDPKSDPFRFERTAENISYPIEPAPAVIYPEKDKQRKMIKPVFNRIVQVSFIVNSIDETARRFNDEYGIGPWRIWEFGPDTVSDMTINGKPEDYSMRLALTKVGNMDVELIQPHDEKSIYADFLRINGEGFHHLAYEVDDFHKLMEYTEKLGVKVLMSGVWCGRHTWVYLDTEDDLKHIVELNYTEPGFVYPDPSEHYPPE